MKKSFALKFLFLFTIALSTCTIQGQALELTAAYGYQFGSKSSYGFNNYVKYNEGDQFSINIGVDTFKGIMAELTYTHQSSEIILKENIGGTTRITDLNADWIMIGATKYISKEKIRPFLGTSIGLAFFNPNNENSDEINGEIETKTYLAFSAKAGFNIMFTEQIGLNIQGNFMIPVQWGGLYLGTGGLGVSGSSNILIGGLSGGLVYRFE